VCKGWRPDFQVWHHSYYIWLSFKKSTKIQERHCLNQLSRCQCHHIFILHELWELIILTRGGSEKRASNHR
jgi:hypothetical protein